LKAVYLNAMGVSCALGSGAAEVRAALFDPARPGGVGPSDRWTPGRPQWLGALRHEPAPLGPGVPARLRSRNNALLAHTLAQLRGPLDAAVARFGPGRVAVVLGTSTAGVAEGEAAARQRAAGAGWPPDYDYAQQEMGSAAAFVARELGVHGPAHGISTACSSAAKALASGARLLRAGLADAVVTGGADTLCALALAGFAALESVAAERSNPMSANRRGINLGEGCALFLMTREPGPVRLAGWGETSDAHHMSAPDPEGRGAADAMRLGLQRAGLAPAAIDYLNLHGTATRQNDAMESRAVAQVLGLDVPVSATKPVTGHALAAAAALEAAIAWLTLVDNPRGELPPHWWDGARDPALAPLAMAVPGASIGRPVRHVLSNSFAFGGSIVALVLCGE
jgi:3-oxoacyl-[acyl-carrier-protein] synthase-1